MPLLEKLTVAELDALAQELEANDYPADGKKDEKVEALRPHVGDEYESKPVFTLTLVEGVNGGQFQASSGLHVALSVDSPTYTTADQNEARALAELPFLTLEDVG